MIFLAAVRGYADNVEDICGGEFFVALLQRFPNPECLQNATKEHLYEEVKGMYQ